MGGDAIQWATSGGSMVKAEMGKPTTYSQGRAGKGVANDFTTNPTFLVGEG